jgi:RNA polymerase sigma factor (sigma-70 family)
MAVTEASHAAARDLDELYRRHGGEVYRYALAVLGNHADAEDVTQTTFLNAYRSLAQGVRPRKPTNWLLTIASNAIKQRFRQEQARPRQVELADDVADASADEETPSVGELLTALSKIPPQQRQAIVLREFEGRSYTEVADILGITISALETLLFRARRSLAEELEHHLTCTEAQLAISRESDGRLGRKQKRRLREHVAECPDCAQFARLRQRHRRALRGLALIPIPISLSLYKSFQGTAAAATLPGAGAGAGAGAAGSGVLGSGSLATGGGLLGGSVALKAAAVVAAVGVAGGAAIGTEQIVAGPSHPRTPAHVSKPSKTSSAASTHGAEAVTGAALGAKGKGKALGTVGLSPGRARSASTPGRLKGKTRGASSSSQSEKTKPKVHGKSTSAPTHRRPAKSSSSQGANRASGSTGSGTATSSPSKGAKGQTTGTTASTTPSGGTPAQGNGGGQGNGAGKGGKG